VSATEGDVAEQAGDRIVRLAGVEGRLADLDARLTGQARD
jgi:hypothetical protein